MISVRVGTHRFHYRAAAIILDADQILLHRLQGDAFWALPGGRVNSGESAAEALTREFLEELGSPVHSDGLACTGENFFEYGGEPHHEIGLYLYARLPVDSPLQAKERTHLGREGNKLLEFRWFTRQDLAHLDMRPTALKAGIASGTLPSHFVQRD